MQDYEISVHLYFQIEMRNILFLALFRVMGRKCAIAITALPFVWNSVCAGYVTSSFVKCVCTQPNQFSPSATRLANAKNKLYQQHPVSINTPDSQCWQLPQLWPIYFCYFVILSNKFIASEASCMETTMLVLDPKQTVSSLSIASCSCGVDRCKLH